jgi:hypothetical protein
VPGDATTMNEVIRKARVTGGILAAGPSCRRRMAGSAKAGKVNSVPLGRMAERKKEGLDERVIFDTYGRMVEMLLLHGFAKKTRKTPPGSVSV